MSRRYPHTAEISISSETDTNNDGITGSSDTEITIQGRFEPANQKKSLDYSAKFYCKNKVDKTPFEVDGAKFIYEGKQFKITQLMNYSRNCVIWLE